MKFYIQASFPHLTLTPPVPPLPITILYNKHGLDPRLATTTVYGI